MPVNNLTLYDLLAHTIPGVLVLVLLLPIWSLVFMLYSYMDLLTTLSSTYSGFLTISLLVISYVLGHILQKIANSPDINGYYRKYVLKYEKPFDLRKIKQPFQYNLKTDHRGDYINYNKDDQMGAKTLLKLKFLRESEEFFNINLISGSGSLKDEELSQLYFLVQSQLFNNGMNRAERWQHLEDFHKAIWIACVLSVGMNVGALVLFGSLPRLMTILLLDSSIDWLLIITLSAVSTTFASFVSYFSYKQRERFCTYWADALWTDFYVYIADRKTL